VGRLPGDAGLLTLAGNPATDGEVALPADVRGIALPTPFSVGPVNAWVLEGDPLVLVDPGPRMHDTRAALDAGLAELGHRLEDVDVVLLTHQHHDHVGQAAEVARDAGAEIWAVDLLGDFLADFAAATDRDDAYAVALMGRHGIDPAAAESLRGVSRAFRPFAEGAQVARRLRDGERVRLGRRTWTVHLRPGHSPTDTLLHDEEGGVLLGGDHLLLRISSNPVAHLPIGARDPEAVAAGPDRPRPLATYLDGMRRTRELDVTLVLPGHGPAFADHAALVDRRVAMHARRARQILEQVDGRRTAAAIGEQLWGVMPVTKSFLVLSEVLGHLDLLAADGLVAERLDGGVVRPVRA
jgi:glyoxylase-like metal-dependent hydrolase (beta-lactamase superfamily II)